MAVREDSDQQQSGSITPPSSVPPSDPELITAPSAPPDSDALSSKGESVGSTSSSGRRLLVSNPQQAKSLMTDQANKARDPSKSTKSPARIGGAKELESRPSIKTRLPGLSKTKKSIELAGPKNERRKRKTPRPVNTPALMPPSPTMQAGGMPIYRTLDEARAASVATVPIPKPPVSAAAETRKSTKTASKVTPGSSPKGSPAKVSKPSTSVDGRQFKPKKVRNPDAAIKRDDIREPKQEPKPVKQMLNKRSEVISEPSNPKIKRQLEDTVKQSAKKKSETILEGKKPDDISIRTAEKKIPPSKDLIQVKKNETQPIKVATEAKEVIETPVGKLPSPPRVANPKPLVAPIIKRSKVDITIAEDIKQETAKPFSKRARKYSPPLGNKSNKR